MDAYTSLARQAISKYLAHEEIMPVPEGLPSTMTKNRAAVFVSLHRKPNNALRGCIGTTAPTQPSLAKEIIHNALSAAFRDPRFLPLRENELRHLIISVDVLSPPEQIDNLRKFNQKQYGLIVKSRNKSGLLLPDIGVSTVAEVFAICCQKGNIDPNHEPYKLYRFTVERHHE